MKVYSFNASADFAIFRDPTVTTSKTTYVVPSKSMVVGLLASMIGIPRANLGSAAYSSEFLDFFSKTLIGLHVYPAAGNSVVPGRVLFYTNHRSLKAAKTKPFKSELLLNPAYAIFFSTAPEYAKRFENRLPENKFVYTPHFGHAYCLARISSFKINEAKALDSESNIETDSVFPGKEPKSRVANPFEGGTLVIERHLHHFVENGILTRRALRYYVPIGANVELDDRDSLAEGVRFVSIGGKAVCLF